MGPGKTISRARGLSGVYERSGGAKRSRRTGILMVEANSVDTGPPIRRGGSDTRRGQRAGCRPTRTRH